MKKWTRALYQPNLPLTPAGFVPARPPGRAWCF